MKKVFKNAYEQMFEWVSFRGNYAVHKKSVLCLTKVLLNLVIFNKALQNEYDLQMFE